MSANVNINYSFTIQAVDSVANVAVYNRAISNFLLTAAAWTSSDFLQVPTAGVAITLPSSPVYFVYVRNLGTNNITLSYTPTGGSSTSLILAANGSGIGGIFLYGLSVESAGGITALSLEATTAVTPAEYFVAA